MKHAGLFAVSISVLVMFTLVHEGSKLNMIDRGIKRTSYTNIDKLKKTHTAGNKHEFSKM